MLPNDTSQHPQKDQEADCPRGHFVDIRELDFDNCLFWSYFLSTSYPCAYLDEQDCQLYELVAEVLPVDPDWSDDFTQYYDGVMEEMDGYVENPTTVAVPISDTEILTIAFHPGDTIYYINKEEIGCTGPHWKLWTIPYQRVKSLLSLENGAVLFHLLLPMAVVEPEEAADLKSILEMQFQTLGFLPKKALRAADCLISGIIRRD